MEPRLLRVEQRTHVRSYATSEFPGGFAGGYCVLMLAARTPRRSQPVVGERELVVGFKCLGIGVPRFTQTTVTKSPLTCEV
jgi:hypothetical protein